MIDKLQSKKLIIKPKSRLSLQYHNHRSEHWTIIDGFAKVYLDKKIINLKPGILLISHLCAGTMLKIRQTQN